MLKADIIKIASGSAFSQPLLANDLRTLISEAIVKSALSVAWVSKSSMLSHPDGTSLAIRQASAIDSARSPRKRPSMVTYDIEHRDAHIHVFAYHPMSDRFADHRDPAQWQFYVVQTLSLPDAKTISLTGIQRLGKGPLKHSELEATIERFRNQRRFMWQPGELVLVK